MPVNEIPPNVKIKVIFRGFIITRITEGAGPAVIGALGPTAPTPTANEYLCHRPKVQIYRINATTGQSTEVRDQEIRLDQDFSLDVVDPAYPGIQEYHGDNPDFNRLDDRENDPKDFRWFVNLNELHRPATITIDDDRLSPKFRLYNGLFHTSDRSDAEMRIRRRPATLTSRFGRVAFEITARIYFKSDNTTRAVFTNGGTTLLTVEPTDADRYDIIYDCSCRKEPEENDFELIYSVITDVAEDRQIEVGPHVVVVKELGSDKLTFFRNPEVYCSGGNGG